MPPVRLVSHGVHPLFCGVLWAVGLLGGELRVDQVSEERGAVCSLVLLAELTVQNSRADPQSHTREYAGPTPKVILEKMARARIVSFI